MSYSTFVKLMNDARKEAGFPVMTSQEAKQDYAEYRREERDKQKYL